VSSFGCEFGLCGIVMASFSAVWPKPLLLFVEGWWVGWLLLVSFLLFVVFIDLGFSVHYACEMTWAFVWKRFWGQG